MALAAGPAPSWSVTQSPHQLPQQVEEMADTQTPSTPAPASALPFGPPKIQNAAAQIPDSGRHGWGATPSHATSYLHNPEDDALPSSQWQIRHQPQADVGTADRQGPPSSSLEADAAAARQGQPSAAVQEAAAAAAGKQPLWRPKPSHACHRPWFPAPRHADGAWTGLSPSQDPVTSVSPSHDASVMLQHQLHEQPSAASLDNENRSHSHHAPGHVAPPVIANGPEAVPAPVGLEDELPATPENAGPHTHESPPAAPSAGTASRQPLVAAGDIERPASARARCMHDLVRTPRFNRGQQPMIPSLASSPSPIPSVSTALPLMHATGSDAIQMEQHRSEQAHHAAAATRNNMSAVSSMRGSGADNAAQKLYAPSAAVEALEGASGTTSLEASAQQMGLDRCKVTGRRDEADPGSEGPSLGHLRNQSETFPPAPSDASPVAQNEAMAGAQSARQPVTRLHAPRSANAAAADDDDDDGAAAHGDDHNAGQLCSPSSGSAPCTDPAPTSPCQEDCTYAPPDDYDGTDPAPMSPMPAEDEVMEGRQQVPEGRQDAMGCLQDGADSATQEAAGATAKPDTTSGSSQTPMAHLHPCKAEPEQEAGLDQQESPSVEQSGQQAEAGGTVDTHFMAAIQQQGHAQQQPGRPLGTHPILDAGKLSHTSRMGPQDSLDAGQLGEPSREVHTHSAARSGAHGAADAAGGGSQKAGPPAGLKPDSEYMSQADAQQPSKRSNVGGNGRAPASGSDQAAHLPEAK